MNKLEKLLDVLGLKIETEYLLIKNEKPIGTKYKIDKEGNFLYWSSVSKKWAVSDKHNIKSLCEENEDFVELPYRPNHGDTYWYVDVGGVCFAMLFSKNNISDLLRLAIGNCFRTEKDAERNADKYVELFENITTGKTTRAKRC